MTYRDLIKLIINDSAQLDNSVTLYDANNDEYYPVSCCGFTAKENSDILDPNHLIIVFK